MRIKEITSQYRQDFRAILVCEECTHEQELTSGYDDFYHRNVLPTIKCDNESCGKSRNEINMVSNHPQVNGA